MASTVPIAGSAYTYAYATMGEFIAWLIGWDLILEYMVGATTVAINWSGYVASFLHDRGIDLSGRLLSSPGTVMIEVPDKVAAELHLRHGWSMLESVKDTTDRIRHRLFRRTLRSRAIINLPAMVIVALVTILLVIGIKESARVNNVIVFIKVSILILLIVLGLPLVNQRTGAASSSRTRMSGFIMAGAASSGPPGSSSSRISASTLSRRPRRRPRTRSATCRSASSGHW